MVSILTAVFTGISATYIILRAILVLTQDAKEPTPIGTTIPFISPIMDLWREGSRYWNGRQSRLPIYTLRLPGARLYIVNDTSLIPLIQRQDDGALFGTPHLFHPTLNPGSQLDVLNRESVQIVASSLDKFAIKGSSTISLFDWVSQQILVATTESVYGPQNPFRDPAVVGIRSKYEAGIIPLLYGVLPNLTARSYVQSREALVRAFVRYYQEDGPKNEDASPLIKAHYEIHSSNGVPLADMARLKVAISIAITSNTMPASFWLIYHIFSDPVVLEDCRKEHSGGVTTNGRVKTIDVTYIKNQCPIFLSTLQETLRLHSTSVASRVVLEEHVLDGQYLLKKGGIVLIPASVQHKLDSAWGPDADKFYHKRFLQKSRGKRYNPVAFRTFGGGSTLCPGRHFVVTEILAFAALVTLRFDIRPRSGSWVAPTVGSSNPATSIDQPDQDIPVDIWPRDSHDWVVNLSESDKKMEISVEDMASEN